MAGAVTAMVLAAFAAGCAANADEVGEGSSSVITSSTGAADLHVTHVDNGGSRCSVSIDVVEVSLPDSEVAKAISKAIASTLPRTCTDDSRIQRSHSRTVTKLNEGGILSLWRTEERDDGAGTVYTARAFNFDLRTGRQLLLGDVVTPSGIKAMIDACSASELPRPTTQEEIDYNAGWGLGCRDAGRKTDSSSCFYVETSGLVLLSIPKETPDDPAAGDVTPWRALDGQIKSSLLKAVAQSSR